MSRDQLSDDGTPAVDTDALGAWVAETAAKKDVSERELLDEILSSYWVLEELSDVVVNGETDPESGDHPATRRESYTEPVRGAAADRGRHPPDSREQPSVEEQDADRASPSDQEPSAEMPPTDEESPADEKLPTDEESTADTAELSEIEQELAKLRSVIDELATEGSLPTPEGATADDDSQSAPDTAATTETDEFAELTAAVTESEPDNSGVITELDNELVEIREQLSELEADLSEQITAESEAREELEAWIETEFDNVEDVLEHLLSTTDNLEYRLGSATDSHRERFEPLEAAQTEREQLRELKNEAIEKGVTTGECDNCGESIDLSLLPAPHCPECDQRLTGITDSSWWPFDSATLRTAPVRRSQTSHSWEPTAEQQSGQTPSGSDQKDQSPPASQTDHQPTPDADGDTRPDTDTRPDADTRPDDSESDWFNG
ncbi:MAG: hypothetical protein J07HN4v3_01857 [Halonotius sp. J07HN4]|jgi:hypothetical protein|nr:MAG: hypothetical protein J07HN4v3_01857 [Halonotius sp. J07HN4]